MEENEILKKIDEELIRELDRLATLSPEDKDYQDCLNAINKLHQMKLDAEKVELEFDERREKRILDAGRADEELRLKEAEERRYQDQAATEKKQFWIGKIIDGATLAINLAFLAAQFKNGYKFEKDGCLTSTTFREVRQKAFNWFKRK